MTEELLTTEEYNRILQEKLGYEVKFKKASYHSVSEDIEGFMGDHYILKIEYSTEVEEKVENFFVKTKPVKTEIQKNMMQELNCFDKEIFYYKYLLKEFEKYGYNTDYAAKSFYCKSNETIVMENLKEKNYQLHGRTTFFDLDHCKITLKSLATYHANAFAYEETKSKEIGSKFRLNQFKPEFFNESFYELNPDSFGVKFNKSTYDCYVKLVDTMPECQEWKKSFKRKLLALNLEEDFNKFLPYRTTVCHGDLWSNNLLFKYSDGVPVHCCLVDYQILRHHHPAFDILLVLYSNTTREFRKEHLQKLLDYYYSTFEEILRSYGYDARFIFSKEDFLKSGEALKPVALLQGTSTRLISFLPPSVLNSFVETGGDDFEKLMFSDKRWEIVVDAFKKDELYRKYNSDDMYDIYELL